MSRKLSTKWTKGLTSQQSENLEKLIRNSTIVLSRLQSIVEEDLVNLNKTTESDYKDPSWSHLQAHKNGKQEYARQILTLLEFLNGERN